MKPLTMFAPIITDGRFYCQKVALALRAFGEGAAAAQRSRGVVDGRGEDAGAGIVERRA